MTDRVQTGARLDSDTYERFKQFTIRHKGQLRGELGRMMDNAMEEYMDNDRTARVEGKIDRVLDRLDEIDGTHTHKHSETATKVERIEQRMAQTERTVIKNDTVVRAIEEVAGADDRTVSKYRAQLKRRGVAYEHPTSNVWTLESQQWASWVESYLDNDPTADLFDILEPYPLDMDGYERLVSGTVKEAA